MKTIHYQNRKYTILGNLKSSTFLMYLVDESNPEDYEQIYQKISNEYQLNIVQPEVASTVVLVWLEEFAKHLAAETEANGNKPVEVVLDSIMTIGTTIRESEEGEKEGNLVPFVTLGEVFKLGAKNDVSTED